MNLGLKPHPKRDGKENIEHARLLLDQVDDFLSGDMDAPPEGLVLTIKGYFDLSDKAAGL